MTGTAGHWSQREDDLLHELPWCAQLVYLRGLRRFVDASTGVVGVKRRISYRSLIETLTVPGARGRHNDEESAPTVRSMRHALGVLERAGLIVPTGDGALVFRLPFAPQDQSVRRMRGTMSDTMRGTSYAQEEPQPNAGLEPCRDAMKDTMRGTMRGTHQSKDIPLGNDDRACRSTSRALDVSPVVEVCMRLRREAGMLDAHPQRPELIGLIESGFMVDDIVGTARELRERGRTVNVGYLMATLRGRRADAERTEGVSNGDAVSGSRRARSVCDEIEQQDREATARERRERIHVVR